MFQMIGVKRSNTAQLELQANTIKDNIIRTAYLPTLTSRALNQLVKGY
jgi:Ran GTPase-activating protein (RanGAP) involved in mRNA processing and transport